MNAEKKSILQRLCDASVMSVERDGRNQFVVVEECDGYYALVVTKDELMQLARELMELAEGKR